MNEKSSPLLGFSFAYCHFVNSSGAGGFLFNTVSQRHENLKEAVKNFVVCYHQCADVTPLHNNFLEALLADSEALKGNNS